MFLLPKPSSKSVNILLKKLQLFWNFLSLIITKYLMFFHTTFTCTLYMDDKVAANQ